MDTLSQAMAKLRKEGYTTDFNIVDDCIECGKSQIRVHPDEFRIDKYYRFEGESNPADESILYAISSEKYGLKGVLVNAMGVYSEDMADEIVKALNINRSE